MSLNMDENEFMNKYGFSIQDFYYICIDDILRKSYWCQSVSELAYDIASRIYNKIDDKETECNGIQYKLTEKYFWKSKIYTHNVAIPYKDVYFTFEIRWTGNCLSVCDWDIKPEKEINNDKNYNDIELLDEELEEDG